MFKRLLNIPHELDQSAFIFGPRGTGKTRWLKQNYPDSLFFDLLNVTTYKQFLADPTRLSSYIPDDYSGWVIIDEIQKAPELLNEVHRLIEHRELKFIMTGSCARSLRRKGVNLLAGRALIYHMHPLTASEIGSEFSIKRSLKIGCLPQAITSNCPTEYLSSYIKTYLREEVLQESLTRNIALFTHFLETASFSQGETINYTEISREVGSTRTTINNFFNILEDLLIAYRLPVFKKRAKRNMISNPKFYYFDTGVYRSIRPAGPLDSKEEADGPALETLFLQQIMAINDYSKLGYSFYYWRTQKKTEVDFIAYGNNGIYAFEIKRKKVLKSSDFKGLKLFQKDYPEAKCFMIYGGEETYSDNSINIIPVELFLSNIHDYFF